MKPAIKELRPFPNVRLLTAEDLIVFSPEGQTTFPAVWIENKGNEAEVSISLEVRDGHLAFRDAVLDRDGTIEAAIHVLRRHFRWKKSAETFRFKTPMWELEWKRLEYFDLWNVAHWKDWNVAGIRWEGRNRLAEKSEVNLGKMELKAFKQRCKRLGLKYEKSNGKKGTNAT